MNLVIERIGREKNSEKDEDDIIDNFPYEFFDEEKNININNKNKEIKNSKSNIKQKRENKKLKNNINRIDNDMVIDFDEENDEREKSNKNNYSLDQEDIIEILNLNNNNEINNSEKKLLEKLNAKILLKDLYEKKKQVKNAYEEYSTKLIETMNNNYVKNILENSSNKKENKKINNDFLIHQQTNTINDINIFCLNNKDNNNILNFNKNNNEFNYLKKNKSETLFNTNNNNVNNINNKPRVSIINLEYKNNFDKDNMYKDFLNEYNGVIKYRTNFGMEKNGKINYELYIDILNDLNYIDITSTPQIYFLNNSIYKNIWNFLVLIESKNNHNNNSDFSIKDNDNDNAYLESNTLLIFLLILNGFFNSVKKLIEIKSELNWLKLENYEKLIINEKYINKNFSSLNEIREKHKKNLISNNPEFNNNINTIDKKIKSVEISGCHDDIISDYFNSINRQTLSNKKIRKNNFSESKLIRNKKIINRKEHKQHQLYVFKPKFRNISFNAKKLDFNKQKNSGKTKNVINNNKLLLSNSSINNLDIKKSLNKSGSKNKNKSKINYIEFVNLSQNDINKKNNKSFFKYDKNHINKRNDNSNSKLKTRNYYNKIKQNRTDLLKLFKNNKYKEGTINEKYEEIKRQRENSKSKGKIKINYENVIKIDSKDKNNEINQKHKFQFRKKEYN